jgi:hypothetical protein
MITTLVPCFRKSKVEQAEDAVFGLLTRFVVGEAELAGGGPAGGGGEAREFDAALGGRG